MTHHEKVVVVLLALPSLGGVLGWLAGNSSLRRRLNAVESAGWRDGYHHGAADCAEWSPGGHFRCNLPRGHAPDCHQDKSSTGTITWYPFDQPPDSTASLGTRPPEGSGGARAGGSEPSGATARQPDDDSPYADRYHDPAAAWAAGDDDAFGSDTDNAGWLSAQELPRPEPSPLGAGPGHRYIARHSRQLRLREAVPLTQVA